MNPPQIPSLHFLHQNKEYGLQLSPKLLEPVFSSLFILSFLYPAFYYLLSEMLQSPLSWPSCLIFHPHTSGTCLVSHTADNVLLKYISNHGNHLSNFCHGHPSFEAMSVLQQCPCYHCGPAPQNTESWLLLTYLAFLPPAPCLFDKYKYLRSRIEWTLWLTAYEIWEVEEEKVFGYCLNLSIWGIAM